MITPQYVRAYSAYNSEMNRRLYAAAGRLSDEERKLDRGAFFGSIHRTFNHLIWADTMWMSRFADWAAPERRSDGRTDTMFDDFIEMQARRVEMDFCNPGLGSRSERRMAGRGVDMVQRHRPTGNNRAAGRHGYSHVQPPDPSSRTSPRITDRRGRGYRRHRFRRGSAALGFRLRSVAPFAKIMANYCVVEGQGDAKRSRFDRFCVRAGDKRRRLCRLYLSARVPGRPYRRSHG